MTLEAIYDGLMNEEISAKTALQQLENHKRTINYFIHYGKISKEPLKPDGLVQLNALVNILQQIWTSDVESPISDDDYETLSELLIDNGVPRVHYGYEINDATKQGHTYPNLRGSLAKVHYLTEDEKRTNKSRKYLDEWIKSTEALYKKNTGKEIKLNECVVMLTPKFDGASVVVEVEKGKPPLWLTRGDTKNNLAKDVSHICRHLNDDIDPLTPGASKFEMMITEEDKAKINQIYRDNPYTKSQSIVTALFNSNDPDFKAKYLIPVPLRRMDPGSEVEYMHPKISYPTLKCQLKDREIIRQFGKDHKSVKTDHGTLKTDGTVITILDPEIQKALGRDDAINNFEIAYKFTGEEAYSRVKGMRFDISEFGFITPVLQISPVILGGNEVTSPSLSNLARFRELNLSVDDVVKVLYDVIPYATRDDNCPRSGRSKIPFIDRCPSCGSELDLGPDVIRVQCTSNNCPAQLTGRILNWCNNLRISNLGAASIEQLRKRGFLDNGIRSLYKLKKKRYDIEDIPGMGRLTANRIIREIEAKRKLKDWELMGSLGIETLNMKTFQTIFQHIPFASFIDWMNERNRTTLTEKLYEVKGIGPEKCATLLDWLSKEENRKELQKLLKELDVTSSFGVKTQNKISFTGWRPAPNVVEKLRERGWAVQDGVTKDTMYLVIPEEGFHSGNVDKAIKNEVNIITKSYLLSNLNEI